MQRRAPYAPMLMDVSHISPCFAYRFKRDGESAADYGRRVADELEAAIVRVGAQRVAAFVAEPVVGATLGCVPAVEGYFARIREICDRYGVLFIAGRGHVRHGPHGRHVRHPARRCLSRHHHTRQGPGRRLPADRRDHGKRARRVRARARLRRAGQRPHLHESRGRVRGSLAVLDCMERDGLLDNVRARGARLRAALEERFGSHPNVGDIRGRGLFLALELVADRARKLAFARELKVAESIKTAALRHGLLCYPSSGTADGERGDHVLLAPPYIVTDEHVAEIVAKLDLALIDVLKESRCASVVQ
jgi:adenosylmethionine-8-amino-7-oxononanoate aminotransferase